MKVLWAVTLSASLIFIIQSIMTFLGADADLSTDFDVDAGADVDMADGHSGMGLLTFRNFVNFCLGFGWTAVLLRDEVSSRPILVLLAVLAGSFLVAVTVLIFKWVSSMQQSGNIDVYKSAVDCVGKVYIPVPAQRSGEGKVQIAINNSVREYDAVTDGEALSTGKDIRVVEVINESTLLVEEINSIII